MNKIASFTVNHLNLLTGVYVSRKDYLGEQVITTFDLRFLRNNEEWKDKTIYFGPMGCRTGFYVIFAGDLQSEDIIDILRQAADFVLQYEGEIPGYSPRDCGNYLDNNLKLAKIYMKKFKEEVLEHPVKERLVYPE